MEKIKILVVDDESRMRKLVRDFLVREDYEVLEAGDGETALDIFYQEKNIALIILDVMMPKMNGWEVCREIRETSKVPIIMLTAKGDEEDELTGFELGVDEYISKPFSPKILVARVGAILRRSGKAPEVEIGLMKLYRATGKEKYKKMARYFLEERGKNPNYFYEEKKKRGWQHWGQYSLEPLDQRYTQTHATIYEQKEAVGHSVRAVYMYTAMADLAGEDKDQRLYEACQTLWDNIVKKRMYITGGIGSTVEGEAFTIDYDLPNDMAYAETCASIGMIFFAKRMLEIRPLGIYADIMEREFYNGTISGIQLDGKQFFYVNPLETNPGTSGTIFGYKHVLPTRPGWYACACCPPNLVRLVTSLGTYAWSESDTTLYSHLFLGQTADFEKAVVKVDSSYPWEGKVTYQVKAKMKDAFELAIHIPSHIRMDTLCVTVNGEKTDAASRIKDGYLYLKQNWGENDVVALTFDLPVRKIYANTNVREDEGCVALMRGPVVYCFEGADNGECIQALRIPREIKAETELCKEGVLAGNVLIHLPGYRMESSDALYSEERPKRTDVMLTAIPYYAWANRGENQMRVWMPEE